MRLHVSQKKHHLKVGISGLADSATGNERINNSLSQKRADYIKALMVRRGIEESLITTTMKVVSMTTPLSRQTARLVCHSLSNTNI